MTFFWQTSLVARLVFSFLLLSLLTVGLLGILAYNDAAQGLSESVLARLEVEASLKVTAVTQWVEEQQREFLLVAGLPPLRQTFDNFVSRPSEDPGFAQRYEALARQATALLQLQPGWRELQVLSARGEILFSTQAENEGDFRILNNYFSEGLKAPYIEKVYPSPLDSRPTMTLSTPIGTDQAPGVLALHLDLNWLDSILERKGAQPQGALSDVESYLVDKLNVPVTGQRFGDDVFRRGFHSPGIRRAISGEDGFGFYDDYQGIPVVGVFRYVEALNAVLMVEVPTDHAYEPARQLVLKIVGVGLAVVLLLTAGTFGLARQIASPVLAVRDTAVQVTQGDLKARAAVTTQDEIGTLAQAFNQMIKELGARNEELSRFAYTVSHDLKSPLLTIQGFLGFLEKDVASGDKERVLDDLARIRAAASTMQQLLDELLELSRIGRVMNPPEEVELAPLIDEVLAATAGHLAVARVEVRVGDALGSVLGDRTRIREVFQNLVENAARFMHDEERPLIEIDAEWRQNEVVCCVRDNGIGIEPEYHQKVFGLFERLDSRTEGTGVGLALVKAIVEHHGGRIWIESEGLGTGTAFFFTLPAVEKSAG